MDNVALDAASDQGDAGRAGLVNAWAPAPAFDEAQGIMMTGTVFSDNNGSDISIGPYATLYTDLGQNKYTLNPRNPGTVRPLADAKGFPKEEDAQFQAILEVRQVA